MLKKMHQSLTLRVTELSWHSIMCSSSRTQEHHGALLHTSSGGKGWKAFEVSEVLLGQKSKNIALKN